MIPLLCGSRSEAISLLTLVLCLCAALGVAAGPLGSSNRSRITALPFVSSTGIGGEGRALRPLLSRDALVSAITCPFTPKPTLVLFTPSDSALADAAVAAVKDAAEGDLLPSGLLAAAYTYKVTRGDALNAALIDLVAPGQDTRAPILGLFCATVDSAYGVPGLLTTAFPTFLPRFYVGSPLYRKQQAALSEANKGSAASGAKKMPSPLADSAAVRQWVLSESATRFVDPVTLAMMPSLHSIFSIAELRALLTQQVAVWGTGHEGAYAGIRASRQPAVVVAAYVHLTTEGSAEVVAALNAASVQLGGAMLVLATDQREVAEALGLSVFNTARVAVASPADLPPFIASVVASGDKGQTVEALSLPGGGAATEIANPTAVGAFLRSVAAQHLAEATVVTAEQQETLRVWGSELQRFMTTSPLRKLTTDEQVRWAFRSQSLKVIFFLRESDEIYFRHHHKVAVDTATRLRKQRVTFKTKSGEERHTDLPYTVNVYWIDAEAHPTVASQLRQATVPSVVVAFPLLSKEEEAARDAEAARSRRAPLPTLNPEGLHGFHTVNKHDLRVLDAPASAAGAGAAPSAPSRKSDLEPLYPVDADELLRFVAGAHFLTRTQVAMLPFETAGLTMGRDGRQEAVSLADNMGYLRLDHRYYAPSLAETAAPQYLRDIFSGEVQLPPFVADEAEGRVPTGAVGDGTSEERAKAAKAKAEWQAQLERRERRRAERVRAKAAEDAARREVVRREIVEEVIKELREGDGDGPDSGSTGVPRPVPPAQPLSARAALAHRKQKALRDATTWKDEATRSATECVVVQHGNRATIFHGLEAPPTVT